MADYIDPSLSPDDFSDLNFEEAELADFADDSLPIVEIQAEPLPEGTWYDTDVIVEPYDPAAMAVIEIDTDDFLLDPLTPDMADADLITPDLDHNYALDADGLHTDADLLALNDSDALDNSFDTPLDSDLDIAFL